MSIQRNILTILTNDCLFEIFRYLKRDLRTLHSCALVNKTFCYFTIPLLWSNPFALTQNIISKMFIIRTYLLFINIDESTKVQLNIYKFPKPFFEYHKFLREFELCLFQEALREFVRHAIRLKTNTNLNKKVNKIIKPLNTQLGNLLLNKNSNLNHLSIHYTNLSRPENQLNICTLDEIDDIISNINKLSLEFSTIENYSVVFSEIISRKKRNLQHLSLSISSYYVDNCSTLIRLLESQKHLKILEISAFWTSINVNSILKTFPNFSYSLVSLKIVMRIKCVAFFFLLDILQNLRNLEVSCLIFQNDDEEFLNSYIPTNQTCQLEYLNFIDPVLLPFRNSLYIVVFEKVKAMSINNMIIPEIYLRQNDNRIDFS